MERRKRIEVNGNNIKTWVDGNPIFNFIHNSNASEKRVGVYFGQLGVGAYPTEDNWIAQNATQVGQ